MSGLGLWGIRSTLCDRRDYSDPELSDINTRIFHEHKRVGFFFIFYLNPSLSFRKSCGIYSVDGNLQEFNGFSCSEDKNIPSEQSITGEIYTGLISASTSVTSKRVYYSLLIRC